MGKLEIHVKDEEEKKRLARKIRSDLKESCKEIEYKSPMGENREIYSCNGEPIEVRSRREKQVTILKP